MDAQKRGEIAYVVLKYLESPWRWHDVGWKGQLENVSRLYGVPLMELEEFRSRFHSDVTADALGQLRASALSR